MPAPPRSQPSGAELAAAAFERYISNDMTTATDIVTLLEAARAGALPGREFVAVAEAYRAGTYAAAFSGSCSLPGKLLRARAKVPAPIGDWQCPAVTIPRRRSPTESAASTKMTAVDIDRSILTKLRPAAVERDCSVERLVRQLLDVIATDKLTGAILDDG